MSKTRSKVRSVSPELRSKHCKKIYKTDARRSEEDSMPTRLQVYKALCQKGQGSYYRIINQDFSLQGKQCSAIRNEQNLWTRSKDSWLDRGPAYPRALKLLPQFSLSCARVCWCPTFQQAFIGFYRLHKENPLEEWRMSALASKNWIPNPIFLKLGEGFEERCQQLFYKLYLLQKTASSWAADTSRSILYYSL